MPITPRPQSSPSSRTQNVVKGALFACALGVFAQEARAQILFSIDYRGPTNGMPVPCAPGVIGPGDVLSVMLPVPCGPDGAMYGPMPPPDVVIAGGFGGLGVPSIAGCVGGGPGVP